MPIVTTHERVGSVVEEVFGEVSGLVVRSADAFAPVGPRLTSIAGGELRAMTPDLAERRSTARARLAGAGRPRGVSTAATMRPHAAARGGVGSERCGLRTPVRATGLIGT